MVLFAMYFAGILVLMLLSAGISVRSAGNGLPVTPAGIAKWFALQWWLIIVRLALAVFIFFYLRENQDTMVKLTVGNAPFLALGFDTVADKVFAVLGIKVDIPKMVPPIE
jgi:hypothetical protein